MASAGHRWRRRWRRTTTVAPTLLLFGLAGLVGGPLDSSLFVVRDRGAPAEAHAQVFTLGAGLRMTAAAVGSGLAGVFAGLGGDGLLPATAGCQLLGRRAARCS